jgi:hypothetical protein
MTNDRRPLERSFDDLRLRVCHRLSAPLPVTMALLAVGRVHPPPEKRYDGTMASKRAPSGPKSGTAGLTTAQLSQAFASLQLPHMPDILPQATLRILVVADLDLSSASELAEYTLRQKKYGVFDASLVDLCIACGPFSRDDDLGSYERGRQQQLAYKKSKRRQKPPQQPRKQEHDPSAFRSRRHRSSAVRPSAATNSATPPPNTPDWTSTPFLRTREETAALEGLMTAALSQLESIVCRVAYCPGASDPLSTLASSSSSSKQQHSRLTPNSRNVHQQWMPLAPGLGCGGFFYLDAAQELLALKHNSSKHNNNTNKRAASSSFGREKNDDDSDASDGDAENKDTQVISREIESLRQR